MLVRDVVYQSNPKQVPRRIEPERSITRAMSRGRCTAWAVAETAGRNCVRNTLLNAPGRLLDVTVVDIAVVAEPVVGGKLA